MRGQGDARMSVRHPRSVYETPTFLQLIKRRAKELTVEISQKEKLMETEMSNLKV